MRTKIASKNLIILILSFIIFSSAECYKEATTQRLNSFPQFLIPDGLGVNIHFIGAPERDIALIKEAHIKLIRADLTWSRIERKKGIYNFAIYDTLVNALTKSGTRVLFILDYGNRLYGKTRALKQPQQIEGFAKFAFEAAKHYKDKNIIWEIWNEPNLEKFWGEPPNPDNYMVLLRKTVKAIRKADPNSLIIAPAVCGCDIGFMKKCIDKGLLEFVDAVSLHPYREGGPETVLECYAKLKNLIEDNLPKNRQRIGIVSSEWGWGLSYLGLKDTGRDRAELKQAEYLTRRFCIEAYAGIKCAVYYKWRENNHGLVRNNYSLKPSYTAFTILNEQLSGYCNDVTRLDIGDSKTVFVFLFKGKDHSKIVAWRAEGTERVSIPIRGNIIKAVDFLGNSVRLSAKGKFVNVELSEKPIFIHIE